MNAGTPNGSTKIRIMIEPNLYFSALYCNLNFIKNFVAQKGYNASQDIKLIHPFNIHLLI